MSVAARLRAVLLLIVCQLAGTVSADSIEMIELRNRPATEVIPLIEPLLDANGSVTGQGFQLFVRSSDENLQQIRRLVSQLDTAPRQLLVSVFQGSERELQALRVDAGFGYQDGDTRIGVGSGRPPQRRAGVVYRSGDATASGSIASTHERSSDNPVHRLRVSEGSAGYIETGASVPFFSGSSRVGGRYPAVQSSIDYRDVTTGFYVLPRVHGEQVTLEISPHKQALSGARGGAIDTQRASTTLTGPLGQWLTLGGVSEQKQRTSSGIASRHSTQSRSDASIWIKAEIVP